MAAAAAHSLRSRIEPDGPVMPARLALAPTDRYARIKWLLNNLMMARLGTDRLRLVLERQAPPPPPAPAKSAPAKRGVRR